MAHRVTVTAEAYEAIRTNDLSILRHLVKNGLLNGVPHDVQSDMLYEAASRRNDAWVRLLVAAGARLNHIDRVGFAPIHWAAVRGCVRTARSLLRAGANPNVRIRLGQHPNPEEFHGRTALHCACIQPAEPENASRLIRLLIAHGALVNLRDWRYRATALHDAALMGTRSGVALLIKAGAHIDARDKKGRTPLHVAAEWGELPVARLLIAAGARADLRDSGGRTPLDLARINAHDRVIHFIERHTDRSTRRRRRHVH